MTSLASMATVKFAALSGPRSSVGRPASTKSATMRGQSCARALRMTAVMADGYPQQAFADLTGIFTETVAGSAGAQQPASLPASAVSSPLKVGMLPSVWKVSHAMPDGIGDPVL